MHRLALPLLLLAAATPAADSPAKDIFRKAVEAQGKLSREQIKDVTLTFEGEVSEDGGVNTVERTYWYRSLDRSFRMRTASKAMEKLSSDRGVVGADRYWERSSAGVADLSRGNRDDRASIRKIDEERGEFERMLRMVLLSRLDGDGWELAMGEPDPVRLEKDQPWQPKGTLGDRAKETYHVLDATRKGEPRLRLFVNTEDFTVRKAVEYDVDAPERVRWVYYFANYEKDRALDLLLPRFFSVYRDTPLDKRMRDELNTAKGEPKVSLNTGLTDAQLRPAAGE